MNITITNKNYKRLIKGASLFTTGGGISCSDQVKSLQNKKIIAKIQPLENFTNNTYLCVAAELGPTTGKLLKKNKYIPKMLQVLTYMTDKNIQGFYPPELGQESILLEVATATKLPIADFDPVGFRAVPCVDIHVFNLLHIPFHYSPMVVLTDRGELLVIEKVEDDMRLEEVLRTLTNLSKSHMLFVLGGVVKTEYLKKEQLEGSYSKAFEYGNVKNISEIIDDIKPHFCIEGKIIKKRELKKEGFFCIQVTIQDYKNQLFIVTVMNEALYISNGNGKIFASVPDKILLIDPITLTGISGMHLTIGLKLVCLVVRPNPIWRTKRANKIFGKKRFEFLLK